MAFALVASVNVQNTGGGTTETTGAIDTTGANLIVVSVIGDGNPGTLTVSDNKGNTYTPLTRQVQDPKFAQLFYVLNPTVGSGHTFTATGSVDIFCAIGVQAFSGAASYDQESGSGNGGIETTIQPGSLTPPADGVLFVVVMADQGESGVHSINQSFIETMDFAENTSAAGGGMSYLIQGTAGAQNPTYTVTGGPIARAARMATFLADTGVVGPVAVPIMSRIGVLRWPW